MTLLHEKYQIKDSNVFHYVWVKQRHIKIYIKNALLVSNLICGLVLKGQLYIPRNIANE